MIWVALLIFSYQKDFLLSNLSIMSAFKYNFNLLISFHTACKNVPLISPEKPFLFVSKNDIQFVDLAVSHL